MYTGKEDISLVNQIGEKMKRVVKSSSKKLFGTVHWSGTVNGVPHLILTWWNGAGFYKFDAETEEWVEVEKVLDKDTVGTTQDHFLYRCPECGQSIKNV